MPLLFKMQETLVTFTLTLILKVILDIPKLLTNAKKVLDITKLLRNVDRLEK